MKSVGVISNSGKKVQISLLADWNLIICIPLFLWNVIVVILFNFLFVPVNRIFKLIANTVFINLSKINYLKIGYILVLNMLILIGSYVNSVLVPEVEVSSIIFMIFLIFSSILSLRLLLNLQYIFSTPKEKIPHKDIWVDLHTQAERLNDVLFADKRSKELFFVSSLISIFVLYHLIVFALSVFFLGDGWLIWILLSVFVYIMTLVDFEMIEHVSSHSARGNILRRPSSRAHFLYFLIEWLRKNVVWPMFLWPNNYYYYTHAFHHHPENNGVADWQSTLRFDQTSFLDFIKAICWYAHQSVFPYESLRYFWNINRLRLFWGLLFSCISGWFVLGILIYTFPLLGGSLLALRLGSGFAFYQFVHRWHGFHNATIENSIEVSNNDPYHFAHHKKPALHLFSEDLRRIAETAAEEPSKDNLHRFYLSSDSHAAYTENWLYVCTLFWQKKTFFLRHLLDFDQDGDTKLENYIKGAQLFDRSPILSHIDNNLSPIIGAYFEKLLRTTVPDHQTKYFQNKNSITRTT